MHLRCSGCMRFPAITRFAICWIRCRRKRVYPVMAEIGDALYQQGYLAGFRSINETLLIALDGTDFFSSEKISLWLLQRDAPEERQGSLSPHCRDAGAGGARARRTPSRCRRNSCSPRTARTSRTVNWPPRPAGWRAGASTTARGASPTWATTLYWPSAALPAGAGATGRLPVYPASPHPMPRSTSGSGDFERNEQLGRVVQARRVGKKHFTDTYRYVHQVQ
jgi:hypothetical protein